MHSTAAFRWTIWWLICLALWLLLTSTVAMNEILAGVVSATVAATVATATRDPSVVARARFRDVRHVIGLPSRILVDTWIVSAALARRITGQRIAGRFADMRADLPHDARTRRGTEAIDVVLTTMSPNAILIGFDEGKAVAFVHTLVPRGHRTLDELLRAP